MTGNLILTRKKGQSIILEMPDGTTCTLTVLERRKNETDFQIIVENHDLNIVEPGNESIKLSFNKVFDRVFSTLKTLKLQVIKRGVEKDGKT
jgi:sRNA-binding carbon storage regulator CsrA